MSFVLILFSVLTGTDIEIFPLKKRQYSKLTWAIFNIFAYYIYYLEYYEWYKSYKSYSGGEEFNKYLQLIISQYFISNKSGIWSLSLIVHSKGWGFNIFIIS